MKKFKEAYAKTGTYKKNGEDKASFKTIGTLFEKDDGSFSLKLDTLPVNFDGWINFSDPKITQVKEQLEQAKDNSEEIPF